MPRPSPFTDDDLLQMLQWRDQGVTVRIIAKRMGKTQPQVFYVLRQIEIDSERAECTTSEG